jgi:hypothetical protein
MNVPITPVMIASSHPGRSIFATTIADRAGFRQYGLSGAALGQPQTDREWYDEAKREVTKFDAFVARLRKLANRAAREDLFARHVGIASDESSGLYARNSVADDVATAESYRPVNILVFALERRRNRVERLDDVNDSFGSDLVTAENSWGILPEPQVIERERIVQAGAGTPSWVAPVVLTALGVAAAAVLGVFD